MGPANEKMSQGGEEETDNGKVCNPSNGEHAFSKVFKCD